MLLSTTKETAQKPPVTIRGVKCANSKPNVSPAFRSCINFDWIEGSLKLPLQSVVDATGKINLDIANYTPKDGFLFAFELTERIRPNFKRVYKVLCLYSGEWQEFGELRLQPHTSFIPAETGILKIDNKFLYFSGMLGLFRDFLRETGIKFSHWLRLDIALDFQRLQYRNMQPEQFLRAVASHKYRMKGRKTERRKLKLTEKKSSANDELSVVKQGTKYKAITWGSYASAAKITMYNKSLEMKEKTLKPWIADVWCKNDLPENIDTWRLEISVRKDDIFINEIGKACYLDHETGEIVENDVVNKMPLFNDITVIADASRLFKGLYERHFQWAINDKTKQFCRMKKIELFKLEGQSYNLDKISEKEKSSNMDKFYIKRLVKEVESYKDEPNAVSQHIKKVIADTVAKYRLEKWFRFNYPEFNLNDCSVPLVDDGTRTDFDFDDEQYKFNLRKALQKIDLLKNRN